MVEDLIMSIDEVNEQIKVARDVSEYLERLESKLVDMLTSADSLGRTSRYFDSCMSKLEGLHGTVNEIRHDWDKAT